MTAIAGRTHARSLLAAAGVSAVALVAGTLVASPSGLRVALAASVLLPATMVVLRAPRAALYGLVTWFVLLGLLRRLTSGVSPSQAWGDPLIMVGASAWVVLLVVAIERGGLRNRGRLTSSVVVLWGLLALSALNPAQGGLTVGLGGLLLVVVPMSAFAVGRALVDDHTFHRLLGVAAWLGVFAAGYGLVQTFVAFPSWDEAWVADLGYTSLNVNGVTRAFASFSAASEYAGFLQIAVVAWVARARGVRWALTATALLVVGMAIWYGGSRGPIVSVLAAIGIMLAAKAGLTMVRGAAIAAVLLLALPTVVSTLAPATFASNPGSRIASRQVEGLTDPFGDDSTLPGHISRVGDGIASALDNPIGVGVGATTISAGKYGGSTAGTEADPGNVPVAAGLPGLLAYASIVILAFPAAYRLARRRQDPVSLAALGILVVTFMGWLNGGHYAVAFWGWLVLGWVDASHHRPVTGPSSDLRHDPAGDEGVRSGGAGHA